MGRVRSIKSGMCEHTGEGVDVAPSDKQIQHVAKLKHRRLPHG